jgi:flagellar motor switch protein FliN/FliY
MTTDEALEQLARQTAEAAVGVLETFCPTGIELTSVSVIPPDGDPLRDFQPPGVAAEVGYVDGVTGGNVLCVSLAGSRRLARAMMGMDATEDVGSDPLDELELSAVSEAANQTMAAAAQATSAVLEQEIEISPPETRAFDDVEGIVRADDSASHLTCASFTILGEQCRLVQVVPTAFTLRMTRALDDRELELDLGAADTPAAAAVRPGLAPRDALAASLRVAPVRLSAELGRRTMPAGRAVALPRGSIVELDRDPADPIDIYVNGRHLALGRLVITEAGRWAVQVERVLDGAAAHPTHARGGS